MALSGRILGGVPPKKGKFVMSTLVLITDADQILKLSEVVKLVRLSRSTIYRKMDQKTFPQSIKLAAKSIGFRLSDIKQYLVDLNK
jgi:prophage regulatory protein